MLYAWYAAFVRQSSESDESDADELALTESDESKNPLEEEALDSSSESLSEVSVSSPDEIVITDEGGEHCGGGCCGCVM